MFNSLTTTPFLKKMVSKAKPKSKRKPRPSVHNGILSACPILPISIDEDCSSTCTHTPVPIHDTNHSACTVYGDNKSFNMALQLFNKQMETADCTSGSSNIPQKWEYKGEIKVSFQLCVLCHDVGKVKSRRDKYYLDVMEVRKYRTVLCKGCLEKILYKTVGNCPHEIQRRMNELE